MAKFRVLFIVVLGLFVASALYRSFYQPSGGHVWRQTDTMGMAMVIAQSWTPGGLSPLDLMWEPRVLQSGEGNGINATEYPILNLMASPFWLLPPRWASVLSVIALFLFQVFVVSHYLKYLLRRMGAELSTWETLAIYFSFTLASERAITFMPEGFAFPLSIVGTACLVSYLDSKRLSSLIMGAVLSATAVLSKPIVVVVFPFYFLCFLIKERKKMDGPVRFALVAFLLSLYPGYYWYGFHSDYLRLIGDEPQFFRQAEFSPVSNLMSFDFLGALKFFTHEVLYRHFPFFFGVILLGLGIFRKPLFVIFYLISFIALCALGGNHVIVHEYYLFPCALFSALILAVLWNDRSAYLRGVARASILIGLIWSIRCNVFAVAKADTDHWVDGRKVGKLLRQDAMVVTDDHTYPRKLLAMKRKGVMRGDDAIQVCLSEEPSRLEKLDIVMNRDRFENSPDYVKSTMKKVETTSENWVLLRCNE